MTQGENSSAFTHNDSANNGRGSYVLLIPVPEEPIITIGSLNAVQFPAGDYAYVGSAMRGFKARLNHHLRPKKKPHWHVDYLLQRATISDIILCESQERTECTIAQAFSRQFDAIPNFGSSDCKCHSHLFFTTEALKPRIITILHSLGMMPKLAREFDPGSSLLLKIPPESPPV